MLNQIRNLSEFLPWWLNFFFFFSFKLRAVSVHTVKVKGGFSFILHSPFLSSPSSTLHQPPHHTHRQLQEFIIPDTSIRCLGNFVEMQPLRSNCYKIIGNDFSPYCAQTIQGSPLGFITLFICSKKCK